MESKSKPRIAKIKASRGINNYMLSEVTGIPLKKLVEIDRSGIDDARFIDGLKICRALGITPEEAIDKIEKLL